MYTTREQWPQKWALLQNQLGAALSAQAGQSKGPEAARLAGEAVAAHRETLRERTREQSPEEQAAALNNLGSALNAQAGLSKGPEAARLAGEAVTAYREA